MSELRAPTSTLDSPQNNSELASEDSFVEDLRTVPQQGDNEDMEQFTAMLETRSIDSLSRTTAGLSYQILCDLIEEATLDIIVEAHSEAKEVAQQCKKCVTNCTCYVVKRGKDIFGNVPVSAANSPSYECMNCKRMYPAARYAPHLEKCMGLAGRVSSRVASQRIGPDRSPMSMPSTPNYSDNTNNSDESDSSYVEPKKKRVLGKSRAASPARKPRGKKKKNTLSDTSGPSNLYGTVVKKLKLIAKTSSTPTSPTHSSTPGSPMHVHSPLRYSFSAPLSSDLGQSHNSAFETFDDHAASASYPSSIQSSSPSKHDDFGDAEVEEDSMSVIEVLQTSADVLPPAEATGLMAPLQKQKPKSKQKQKQKQKKITETAADHFKDGG